MALTRKNQPTASITAAVKPLNIRNATEAAAISQVSGGRKQREAWSFYESMSELNYPTNYLGRNVARFHFPVGVVPADDLSSPAAVPERAKRDKLYAAAEQIAFTIRGEDAGLADLAEGYTKNMAVAGEGWFVGRQVSGEILWSVFSVIEFGPTGSYGDTGQAYARYPLGNTAAPDWSFKPGYLRRIWQPSPKLREVADTTTFAVLDKLKTLAVLDRSLRARIVNSLTQSGFLFMPSQLSLAGPIGAPTGNGEAVDDPFAAKILSIIQAQHDSGDASATPALIRGDAALGEAIKFITMDRTIDRVELELRSEQRAEIAKGMFLPPEVIEGMGSANHWCRTDDTLAFVRGKGWTHRDALAAGDEIITVDHETGLSAWSAVESVYAATVADQPMVEVVVSGDRGPSWTITQTPEHRNPIIRGGRRMMVLGSDLNAGDILTTGAPASDLPAVPSVSDDFAKLVAWYSADGTITGTAEKPGQIRIAKSWKENPDKVARMVQALTGVFGPARESMPRGIGPAWRMEVQDRGMAVAVLNGPARDVILGVVPGKEKVIPREFVEKLTASQLEGFLDAWLDSDGDSRRITDDHSGFIWQRNPARLDAIEYAAVRSGRAVRRRTLRHNSGFKGWGDMHGLSVGSQRQVKVRSVGTTTYSGVVWCPKTANGTWLARSGDGWSDFTGNSSWSVSDSAFVHLLPYAQGFADLLTMTVLWPLLRDAIRFNNWDYTELDVRRHKIIPDGSDVISRPNEAEDGRQLHDRMVISDKALRDRSGVGEGDEPTEDEYVRQIGRRINNPYLATYGMDVHDKIDWEEMAAVAAGPGRPGVGSTDEAHRPADSSDPAGAPGEGDTKAEDEMTARLLVAASPGFLLAARKKVGAKLRARCEPDKELHASLKHLPNEEIVGHPGLLDAIGLSEGEVRKWFLSELSGIADAVRSPASAPFIHALAAEVADGGEPDLPALAVTSVLAIRED